MKFFIDSKYIWATTKDLHQRRMCYVFRGRGNTWDFVPEALDFPLSRYCYTFDTLSELNKERVGWLLEQLLGDSDV